MKTIKDALFKKVAAVLAGKSISWPDVDFKPSPTKPYYQVEWFPSDPDRRFVGNGDSHWYEGLLQIMVCFPSGKGVDDVMNAAQEVVSAFPVGLTMQEGSTRLKVLSRPAMAVSMLIGTHYAIPVTVRYGGFN